MVLPGYSLNWSKRSRIISFVTTIDTVSFYKRVSVLPHTSLSPNTFLPLPNYLPSTPSVVYWPSVREIMGGKTCRFVKETKEYPTYRSDVLQEIMLTIKMLKHGSQSSPSTNLDPITARLVLVHSFVDDGGKGH